MEISNKGTGQYFLNKLNVRKIQKCKENVSYIKTITAKERHSRLHSHRYIFQYGGTGKDFLDKVNVKILEKLKCVR